MRPFEALEPFDQAHQRRRHLAGERLDLRAQDIEVLSRRVEAVAGLAPAGPTLNFVNMSPRHASRRVTRIAYAKPTRTAPISIR